MKQIQDIEDQYAERVQKLVAKIENFQSLQEERERVNAIVIAKKLELKSSIEKFLKENEDFKKKELEMQKLQEKEQQNREMEKLENQRLLEHMEIERLNLEYHKKLDDLEKKSVFLDWRTKRVQLSNDRKKILDEPWNEAPLYTFETEKKFNYVLQHVQANEIAYPHETTKVVNQNLHTLTLDNGMVNSDCVNLEEQKYLDQEGTNQTLKVTKTQIEDIGEKVLEGQSSNSNHESSQLQSDVEMPNESTMIENSFTKDQELINWMLHPCERNDTIQVVQPNTDIWLKDQFQIVLSISQDFDEMLVSMDESINQTVLFQVQTQLDLLSLLSCSQMFNFEREIDHSDLRFHLNILKQFYLMGDGELVQLLTDRLFKENRSSLNLNGSLSKIPSNQLEFIFQDIIATSTKKIQGNLNIDDLFEIHLNVSATGLELADCIRFTYKPPKPFNIVIDPFLQDYSKVFSFIVPILQASEACNRIKYTLKWKNQSNSIDGESIRTTQLLHKCHWLINSTLFYIFEHGITYPWVDFIKQIDMFVNKHTSYRFNLKSVVNSHANVLQSIHCNLFLHTEQTPIRQTILELCSTIVDFSKMMQRIQVDKTFTQLEMQFETGLKDLVKLLQIWINRGHEKSTIPIYHEMLAACK
ncbi:Gamma-tubulin complex component 6 [Boothiomyces sp. JEL0838]|nr:Gamma-tubulin complex component 6 [Boothiomyces sp. JEL0838]